MTQHMAGAGQLEAGPGADQRLRWACSPVIRRLETWLKDSAWSLSTVGEDQTSKLELLTVDLHRRPSAMRDGKRIIFLLRRRIRDRVSITPVKPPIPAIKHIEYFDGEQGK